MIEHTTVETNGVRLHLASAGEGPLVLLLHGFPESAYSWRHQLEALAAAGYRAVAPDQRGYGDSDRPQAIEAYDQVELAADAIGVLDALGEERAVVVGHDWGAPVAWHSALLHPDRVSAVVGMSVPYGGRGTRPPLEGLRKAFQNVFFYILYFQEPGVAEAELEADVRRSLRTFYFSASADAVGKRSGKVHPPSARLLETMQDTDTLPPWLAEADLDVFTAQFEKSGFRGPLNWYRNFDRTWERTAELADARIAQPALFITGEHDPVRAFTAPAAARMPQVLADLRGQHTVGGAGHWVQQEKPEEVNRLLLAFLSDISK